VDLGRTAGGPLGRLHRVARGKRWLYVAIAADPVLVGLAVVRLGYAANAFAFVYHAGERRMLVDASSMGPSFAAEVADSVLGVSTVARFRSRALRAAVTGVASTRTAKAADVDAGRGSLAVTAAAHGLELRAHLDAASAPPSISAIARLAGGRPAATEKRALLAVSGEVIAAGRRFPLDGGLAAYDYTQGLMPRRTAWSWALALGRAADGEPFALNLVQGHVGEAECAAWTRDGVHPLAEGRFAFDPGDPLSGWRMSTADGSVDLRFAPGSIHAEKRDLGLIRSRFLQPVGAFEGTVRLGSGSAGGGAGTNTEGTPAGAAPDREIEVASMLGVTESQDVLW